ncbi:MAG: hypothetical protein ACHQ49_05530 [Elusimicrobiota bacterium]
MKFALLLATLAVSPSFAASPFALAARLTLSGEDLAVGAADKAANGRLDCAAGTVQRTVLRCKPNAAVTPFASCLGRRVESAAVTLHFQGEVVNMSVEFSAGNGVDDVLNQLRSTLGAEPKVQYWADDAYLFASYIWVDQETEIEVTKTLKGSGDGKVRLYASTLLGGLPLSTDDGP